MIFILIGALSLAMDIQVNRSIQIADDETKSDDCSTVNGKITIGDRATVAGDCRTVNGAIRVGTNSKVKSLRTVNGTIKIAQGSNVSGDLETVNGSIILSEVSVLGNIETVNGRIRLTHTSARKDLTTVNGHIDLTEKSHLAGSIIIKDSHRTWTHRQPIEILIADDSVVDGDIRVQDDDLEVIVYLKDGGTVKGDIINAKVVH